MLWRRIKYYGKIRVNKRLCKTLKLSNLSTNASKIIENAAGSLYANYQPNKVSKGQYVKFNFNIYNKISGQ